MSEESNDRVLVEDWTDGVAGPSIFRISRGPRPQPRPGSGEFLQRTLLLSIDPSQRGYVARTQGFWPRVPRGEAMKGRGLAEVVESSDPRFPRGALVFGETGWQQWSIGTRDTVLYEVCDVGVPLEAWCGLLGTTGLTAWCGLNLIGQPRAGETVAVTSAAGAVGSVAVQLARIAGARVVAITGSGEKARLCREVFGADEAIDYRACGDLAAALRAQCPDGVDVFFDSVGGAQLDAGIDNLNVGGRVVVCGTISVPSDNPVPLGRRHERAILTRRARVQGLLVADHTSQFERARRELLHWHRAGRLRSVEDILDGLERAPEALERVLTGRNVGKQLVRVGARSAG